jgi:hypothetical protein
MRAICKPNWFTINYFLSWPITAVNPTITTLKELQGLSRSDECTHPGEWSFRVDPRDVAQFEQIIIDNGGQIE